MSRQMALIFDEPLKLRYGYEVWHMEMRGDTIPAGYGIIPDPSPQAWHRGVVQSKHGHIYGFIRKVR